mmetsp:Transcript_4353/g.12494  ORF Transcript_4353/g.12494 Transcript_4353/m.12494 type:complete len:422 (+) Transcript_4353:665-1930(+)
MGDEVGSGVVGASVGGVLVGAGVGSAGLVVVVVVVVVVVAPVAAGGGGVLVVLVLLVVVVVVVEVVVVVGSASMAPSGTLALLSSTPPTAWPGSVDGASSALTSSTGSAPAPASVPTLPSSAASSAPASAPVSVSTSAPASSPAAASSSCCCFSSSLPDTESELVLKRLPPPLFLAGVCPSEPSSAAAASSPCPSHPPSSGLSLPPGPLRRLRRRSLQSDRFLPLAFFLPKARPLCAPWTDALRADWISWMSWTLRGCVAASRALCLGEGLTLAGLLMFLLLMVVVRAAGLLCRNVLFFCPATVRAVLSVSLAAACLSSASSPASMTPCVLPFVLPFMLSFMLLSPLVLLLLLATTRLPMVVVDTIKGACWFLERLSCSSIAWRGCCSWCCFLSLLLSFSLSLLRPSCSRSKCLVRCCSCC